MAKANTTPENPESAAAAFELASLQAIADAGKLTGEEHQRLGQLLAQIDAPAGAKTPDTAA